MRGSISGKTVVVTRPKAQAQALIQPLKKYGARVIAVPLIKIVPPSSFYRLDGALKTADEFDGMIFTSRNAVESFFDRARKIKIRLKRPARLWAVGGETAKALKDRGWSDAITPKESHGKGLARAIGNVRGLKLLLPRAKVAGEDLPRVVRAKGAQLTIVEAYRTVLAHSSSVKTLKRIDAVTFSSGSTVDAFVKLFGKARAKTLFKTASAVSIGPVTSAALRRHGIKPVQAKTADSESLARAVVAALK